jgi:hypothetical protein
LIRATRFFQHPAGKRKVTVTFFKGQQRGHRLRPVPDRGLCGVLKAAFPPFIFLDRRFVRLLVSPGNRVVQKPQFLNNSYISCRKYLPINTPFFRLNENQVSLVVIVLMLSKGQGK